MKPRWLPGYDTFVLWNRPKTSSFRLPYQLHSSSADWARELFKPTKNPKPKTKSKL